MERRRDLRKEFDGDVDERFRRVVMDVEFELGQPRARVREVEEHALFPLRSEVRGIPPVGWQAVSKIR